MTSTILGKCQPLLIKCCVLVHNIRGAEAVWESGIAVEIEDEVDYV